MEGTEQGMEGMEQGMEGMEQGMEGMEQGMEGMEQPQQCQGLDICTFVYPHMMCSQFKCALLTAWDTYSAPKC